MPTRITLLSDGVAWADGGGAFGLVPRTKWVTLLPPDDQNRVPQALWCCLVEVDGLRVLVDTGAGDKSLDKLASQYALKRDDGTLLERLSRLGLRTDDIDIVIQTHLHGDHCGWATRRGDDGRIVPTFGRAKYYVQSVEFADALHPNERTRNTYFGENFIPLNDSGVLNLLSGETAMRVSPVIRTWPGMALRAPSV